MVWDDATVPLVGWLDCHLSVEPDPVSGFVIFHDEPESNQ